MTTIPPLSVTQYRLARHYLQKLRRADAAYRRGHSSVDYGLTLFAQDWEQIRHWQSWSATQRLQNDAFAEVCKEFPLAGKEVLSSYTSLVDYARWLESGLAAAQQLHDSQAERRLYNELARVYYRLGTPEKVEPLAKALLALGEAAHDPLAVVQAVALLGVFSEERGLYSDAEHYYGWALELATELQDEEETARALNGLAAIALYRGDYAKAYPYLVRQLELMEESGKQGKICHALISMGRGLTGLREYDRAEACLLRAVTLARSLSIQRLLGVGLLNLCALETQRNHLDNALRYCEEGLQAVRDSRIPRQIVRGLAMLGDLWVRLGDLPKSLASLQEGLQIACGAGLPRHICDLQRNLANTYLAMSDLDAARSALYEALTLAQTLDSETQKIEALVTAVAYLQQLGFDVEAGRWAGAIPVEQVVDVSTFNAACALIETALGSEAFQAALEEGQAMGLADAVNEAIHRLRDLHSERAVCL